MDHAVNGGVLLEDLVEGRFVCNVCFVELGPLARDELDAVEGDLGRVVEVVDNHDIVAVLEERKGGEGANVASATAGMIVSSAYTVL